MHTRIRFYRAIALSAAVLLLLSCQIVSNLIGGGEPAATSTAAFTLVESSATEASTAAWTPVFTAAESETALPSPVSGEALFSATPTSLASATPEFTLTPVATFTLGTPLPSNTPFPTPSPFIPPTATLSGPLVIDLNGYWDGVRRFEANCGKCDSSIAHRVNWIITHDGADLFVNVGLSGSMGGLVAVLSGTENYIYGGGWVKLNYILTLQPDGDTLKGRFWGEGRLPSPCVGEIKLRSCDIFNGSMTMAR